MVSLDFELHWGMRDHVDRGSPLYGELGPSRDVTVALARHLADRSIHATWATVGLLFASSRDEAMAFRPERRPRYRSSRLDPYQEPIGPGEAEDPEHLAGSLVSTLAETPGQEIASHTFSHYYCLEDGQTEAHFRADLAAAQAIAVDRGLRLTSLVLPRNQWNPAYTEAVLEAGFTCIRGSQPSFGHRARAHEEDRLLRRASRLVDTYVGLGPPPTTDWASVRTPSGLCDLPASAFLRPYSPSRSRILPLQERRLVQGLTEAARRGRIFHLWWHPHNFAGYPQESFALLDRLLDAFDRLAASHGMISRTMAEVAHEVGAVPGRHDRS